MSHRYTLSRRATLGGAAALAAGAAIPAAAQDNWPTKPVKLIVPSGAGSGTDIVARVFAESLSSIFKQPFVVEVKPGANGMIGTREVAKAPADGYTLLFTYAAAQVINQSLYPNSGYDGAKDFAAVAVTARFAMILVVNPNASKSSNLKELIEEMKKADGKMNYASVGAGSLTRAASAMR